MVSEYPTNGWNDRQSNLWNHPTKKRNILTLIQMCNSLAVLTCLKQSVEVRSRGNVINIKPMGTLCKLIDHLPMHSKVERKQIRVEATNHKVCND